MNPEPGSLWLVEYESRIDVVRVSPDGLGFFAPGQEECWMFSNAYFIKQIREDGEYICPKCGIRQNKEPEKQFTVIGDHPVFARPDKAGLTETQAHVYKRELEAAGFDNVRMIEDPPSF